jgi:hypothetical protein
MPIDNISISTTHDTKYFILSGLKRERKLDRSSRFEHLIQQPLSSMAASMHARAHVVGWTFVPPMPQAADTTTLRSLRS